MQRQMSFSIKDVSDIRSEDGWTDSDSESEDEQQHSTPQMPAGAQSQAAVVLSPIETALLSAPVSTPEGLAQLNALLATSTYVLGPLPSQADVDILSLLSGADHASYPHLERWRGHVTRQTARVRASWPVLDPLMPRWLSKSVMCGTWARQHCALVQGEVAASCPVVQDISNMDRPHSTLRFLVGETSMVLKQIPDTDAAQRGLSRALGLAREGLFYKHMAPQLEAGLVPIVHYAHGVMETGAKCILMEDLSSSVDSGRLFGPGNPNNHGKDLEAAKVKAAGKVEGAVAPTVAEIASKTFKAMAKVHAHFWRNPVLLSAEHKPWLRGAGWLLGESKATWEGSQAYAKARWATAIEERKAGTSIEWNPLVWDAAQAAVDGISWEARCTRLHEKANWTLVHGDFWPGNVLWRPDAEQNVVLVDWEMVGVGSAAQDLGQYMVSNCTPEARRGCEKQVVEEYYAELISHGVDGTSYTFDECWGEYTKGGLQRWLWFVCYFAGAPSKEGLGAHLQFFHDQVLAFMQDHDLTAKDVEQIRS